VPSLAVSTINVTKNVNKLDEIICPKCKKTWQHSIFLNSKHTTTFHLNNGGFYTSGCSGYIEGLYKNKHGIFSESGMAFELSEADADAVRVISERMKKMFEKNRYGEKEIANWDRFYRDFLSQNIDILYDTNNLVVKKIVRRILLDEQYIQIGGELDEIKFTRKKDE